MLGPPPDVRGSRPTPGNPRWLPTRALPVAEVGAQASGERDSGTVRSEVEDELREHGWWNPCASSAVFGAVVADNGLGFVGLVGILPLCALAMVAFVMAGLVSNLSRRGGREALRWKAYRAGLKSAAADSSVTMDLDEALPDVIAMGLGDAYRSRLKEASAEGSTLRAFQSVPATSGFIPWIMFTGAFASSSGAGTSVSTGGSGGGGGAAGST